VSRDAGLYAYGRIAANLIQLVAIAIIGRVYTPAAFEYVSAILLLCESAAALGSMGLADAVFYYIGRTPERAAHIVRQTSFLLLVVAVPVIGIVTLAGARMRVPVGPALPWLALTLLVELPTQPAVNQLLAVGQAGLASALYLTFQAIRPVVALVPWALGLPISAIPPIMAAFGVLRLTAHLVIVRKWFPLPRGERWLDPSVLRGIVLFAFPAGIAVLGGKLNPQIDKYVVQAMRGNLTFALYSAAAWELPLISMIPYAIGAVSQARYTRLYADGKLDELRALWLATVRKTTVAVVPLAVMAIALGAQILAVYQPKYAAAGILFQIFTVVLLHRVASYGAMLQSIGATKALLVTSTLLLVTNLILTVPLTKIGFAGAAIATVVANVPPFLYTMHRIARGLQVPIRKVMPWGFYGATLALAGALGLGVWLLARHLPFGPGAQLGIGAAIFLPAYVILGRAVGVVKKEDTAYAVSWLTLSMLKRRGDQPSEPSREDSKA
jgi:O-antigen/teichoic acid export membrane protein